MSFDVLRPTTLTGVKRLAVQIRKQSGLKHSDALDLAARVADFQNYRHARSVLPVRSVPSDGPYVLLTAYWWAKDSTHRSGRETLRIGLSKPLFDICSKSDLKRIRGFGNLRMVAADHFICDTIFEGQESARKGLCQAERSLRFMEHTGLRPRSRNQTSYKDDLGKLPYSDHATEWVDWVSGQRILVDEPYPIGPRVDERAAWAAERGWDVRKSVWPGMYFPHHCDLYVATEVRNGFDLAALVAIIDAMPVPLVEYAWVGDTVPSWDTFISPMASTPQDVRRARPRGMIYPAATSSSVPYDYRMGTSRRRPRGTAGVERHIEMGSIIKAVMGSRSRPPGVYTRMSSLRATLEDWMSLEIGPNELQGPDFFDVYYRETAGDAPFEDEAGSTEGVKLLLERLRSSLLSCYPDSVPLRQQLNRVEVSLKLTAKLIARSKTPPG